MNFHGWNLLLFWSGVTEARRCLKRIFSVWEFLDISRNDFQLLVTFLFLRVFKFYFLKFLINQRLNVDICTEGCVHLIPLLLSWFLINTTCPNRRSSIQLLQFFATAPTSTPNLLWGCLLGRWLFWSGLSRFFSWLATALFLFTWLLSIFTFNWRGWAQSTASAPCARRSLLLPLLLSLLLSLKFSFGLQDLFYLPLSEFASYWVNSFAKTINKFVKILSNYILTRGYVSKRQFHLFF